MKNKTKYILSAILTIVSLLVFTTCIVLTSYFKNLWWTIILSIVLFIISFTFTIIIYLKHVEFICPICNTQFKSKKVKIIMAIHTPTKRLLKCPNCNKTHWCKEIIVEKK